MKMGKQVFLAVMLAITAVTAINVSADDYSVKEPNLCDNIARKLGRGVSNVAFGIVEFPINWYQVNFEEGGFAACTYGIFRGLIAVVIREVVGVVEIITFLAPLPGCSTALPNSPAWGYGPILKPEWIITPSQDKYNFVYPHYDTLP